MTTSPYLWTEHYRPKTLDDFVWRNPEQRTKVEEWIRQGSTPHLMFSGVSGTGKTTLAKLILSQMKVPSGDILFIPASRERKIEMVQERISDFVGTWALGESGIKYVLLDEADALSPLAQRLLRGEMDIHQDLTRFIFTCNYPAKIIPAIHGRCQGFHFDALDRESFTVRIADILVNEGIDVEACFDAMLAVVDATYPDMRKAINLCQQNVSEGVLHAPAKEDAGSIKDYLIDVAALFKAGRTLEARKLLVEQAQVEEYPDIFRYFYKNLDLWGSTEDQKDEALITIRRGLVNHALVADPEINMAAMLVELSRIARAASEPF